MSKSDNGPKSRPLLIDPSAKSASPDGPAFINPPPGAPAYHGFPVIESTLHDGWRYGAITAFAGHGPQDSGDGFVISPSGDRAGIVWSVRDITPIRLIPPEPQRWGVYEVSFPFPVEDEESLAACFRSILPFIKREYELFKASN